MHLTDKKFHSKIYYWGLILLIISIPLSEFMMSVSQIILAINWISERGFKKKIQILRSRKSILIFTSIFLIHILGGIYSNDITYWLNDLRIKLPILILPLIIGTSYSLNIKEIKTIFMFFYIGLCISSIASILVLFGIIENGHSNGREISLFISHIRFSLLLNLAIFSIYYFIKSKNITLYSIEKYSIITLAIWFIIFLFILNSLTGIIVFIIISTLLILYSIFNNTSITMKIILLTVFSGSIIFSTVYINNIYITFTPNKNINLTKLEDTTSLGNKYKHNTSRLDIENGSYTHIYVCEKEIEKEWNRISYISYRDQDKSGNKIRFTLKRYLTSLGLRKDAKGIKTLSNKDISAIENGIANKLYLEHGRFYNRIHKTIYEIESFHNGGNPSGHSLIQRLEYLKTSFAIISQNIWIGVGSGDVKAEFKNYFKNSNTELRKEFWHKSHNQFVLFIVAFGLIGFCYLMIAIFAPIFLEKQKTNFLFKIFLTIAILSMLNEDTIETQAGVTFFAFFYSLLLFGLKQSDAKKLN